MNQEPWSKRDAEISAGEQQAEDFEKHGGEPAEMKVTLGGCAFALLWLASVLFVIVMAAPAMRHDCALAYAEDEEISAAEAEPVEYCGTRTHPGDWWTFGPPYPVPSTHTLNL